MFMEVGHGVEVDFDHFEGALFGDDVLGEHAHAGTHFEDGDVGAGINGVCNPLCYTEVGEEMLTQEFLRFYAVHEKKSC